jgi:antitoxin MazE
MYMKAHIIQVGNSKGVRIPKAVLAELQLEGEVELEVEDHALVIRRARKPREGWEAAFAAAGPQPLLDPELPTRFDEGDWQW